VIWSVALPPVGLQDPLWHEGYMKTSLVRAFSAERQFLNAHYKRVDNNQRFWYFTWMVNRCASFPIFVLLSCVTSIVLRAASQFRRAECGQRARLDDLRACGIYTSGIRGIIYRQCHVILYKYILDVQRCHRTRTLPKVKFHWNTSI
jgi:hypothetical protein